MRTLHTTASIGDQIKWGIHEGEVKRILIDEQGLVQYELQHIATIKSEDPGGPDIVKTVCTWVKESECQTT